MAIRMVASRPPGSARICSEWQTSADVRLLFLERNSYISKWVNLWLVDVEQPDGGRWEYHVVRMRHLSAVAVVDDRQTAEEAAVREVEEETGWRPGPLTPIVCMRNRLMGSPILSISCFAPREPHTLASQPNSMSQIAWSGSHCRYSWHDGPARDRQ